jgi:predicted RNA-binding protein with PIN domain
MKVFLIDTFNLIHKDKESKSLFLQDVNSGISSIASKISLYAQKYKSWKFKLILDGSNYSPIKPSANIVFVESENLNADNKIKELIQTGKNKKNIKVVSSDTEVFNYARLYACDVITSEEFLKKFLQKSNNSSFGKNNFKNKSHEKPTRPSKKEYNELLKVFKENDFNDDIF